MFGGLCRATIGSVAVAPQILERTLGDGERAVLRSWASLMRRSFGDDLGRMLVYGSRARGDSDDQSDIDVLVVVRGDESEADRRAWQLLGDIKRRERCWTPISLVVLSEQRFDEMQRRELRFALDAVTEGIPL